MKCLVTKFKAIVNNDDLPFFDSLKLNALSDSSLTSRKIYIKNQNDFMVILPEGEYLVTSENGNTPLVDVNTRIYNFVAGDYTLYPSRVGDDYTIILTNASTIRYIYGGGSNESIKIYPDMTPFVNNRVIDRFGSPNFSQSASYKGDMSCFFHNNTVSYFGTGNNRIPGAVESMVETAWNYGRRTGTVVFSKNTSSITLNGSVIGSNKDMWFIFSATNVTVAVDSISSIVATYNGSIWTYA